MTAAAPASTTAAPASTATSGSAGGQDGFTGSLTGTFGRDAALYGGMLTGHFGILRWIAFDVAFETATSLGGDVDARETGITFGMRIVPNPRARFRLQAPIRVGGLVSASRDDGAQRRSVDLTADAGIGLGIRIVGPFYVSLIGRAQARKAPGDAGVNWVAKGDLGITFLF